VILQEKRCLSGKANYSGTLEMAYFMRCTKHVKSFTIRVPSIEKAPNANLSDITEYFAPEKRDKLIGIMRSGSGIRNIAYYHQAALNQMTAKLVAEAKLKDQGQQQPAQANKKGRHFFFRFWQK